MVENLSVEMKNRRQEVIEDRQGMCVTCSDIYIYIYIYHCDTFVDDERQMQA